MPTGWRGTSTNVNSWILVFFVYGLAPLGGRHELASRVTAIKFVSVFSTKDAHTQIWNAGEAFDQSLMYSRVEEREATACKLPFVGVDYLNEVGQRYIS